MDAFTYQACFSDKPCSVTVREKDQGLFMITRNDTFLMYMQKIEDVWHVIGTVPEGIYSDDVSAIGEEIENNQK